LKFLLSSLCLFLGLQVNAQTENPELNNFVKELNILQADFTQNMFAETGELLETSSGKFTLKKPNNFRWKYEKPYQQLIVANGKKVWIYDHDLEQVTIKDYQETLTNSPIMLLINNQVAESFIAKTISKNQDLTEISLTPKSTETAQFQQMVISFNKLKLKKIFLIDKLDQTTEIIFENTRRNLPLQCIKSKLDNCSFNFIPTKNIDIIDGR
jgi:outer membrane lipoprotein carrier protein